MIRGGESPFGYAKQTGKNIGHTIGKAFTGSTKIGSETVGAVGDIGSAAIGTTGKLGVSALDATGNLGVGALDATEKLGVGALDATKKVGVGALGLVGNTTAGVFKGAQQSLGAMGKATSAIGSSGAEAMRRRWKHQGERAAARRDALEVVRQQRNADKATYSARLLELKNKTKTRKENQKLAKLEAKEEARAAAAAGGGKKTRKRKKKKSKKNLHKKQSKKNLRKKKSYKKYKKSKKR